MAIFDNIGGLLGDLGIGVPRNTGLISDTADIDAINKRALMSGGVNALLTYLATPKNLNAGSPLPYLGRAALSGFGASQNVIDQALNTAYRNKMLAGREDNIRTYEKDRQKITEQYDPTTKTWSPLAVSPLDAPKEAKEPTLPNLAQEYEYAVSKGYKGKFEDWKKLSIDARLAAEMPLKTQESQYKYGTTPPPPQFASMKDVSDTAKATGKTTDQVIKDLKSRGIEVRTK